MQSNLGAISCGNNPYARATLCALPNDVLLKILGALDARSAVAFNQICKALYTFATSRQAWLTIARTVSRTGVLPLPLHNTYPTPAALSTPDMKAAVQRAINTERVLGRASPVTHVHPHLGNGSGLRSSSAYSLLSDTTVVHTAFLPGGRFLLTVQLDGSFACWDLESPTRTRCVRLQTGSDANAGEEQVEPRCVAYWKTGAAYVEFAHDVVEEGCAVIVSLLVVDIIPDQQALSRNLHVVRIELPAPNSRRRSRPAIPDDSMYNMRLLASAPIPHPLFVCSSYVHASGHAGLIGNVNSEVIFVLFFNPRPPPSIVAPPRISTFADAQAAVQPASSRVVLIQCGFRTKPTRFYALGSADHIILYCESGGCVYSYAHSVATIRAQAFALPYEADRLIVSAPAPHEDAYPEGQQGTPGAPHIQKMCVVLRKPAPAWLEYGEDWIERAARWAEARQAEVENRAPAVGLDKISAMSMTIDAETSNLDAFRGIVIGMHNVDVGRKSVSVAPSSDEELTSAAVPSSPRPHHVPSLHPSSSPPPTPSPIGLPSSPPSSSSSNLPVSSLLPPPPPQPPRYRRECRVRYKRTVFPSRLTCTWHELAALGTHGYRAIWIEGDGPPPEEDGATEVPPPPIPPESLRDESMSLRVMLASVGVDGAREVAVPASVKTQLGRVSCVALEDSVGMLAMATLDGRVILLEFV
ncbi:F-box-like protein [Ceratobasidium sp. AG-Ba]|nr:F-box-like protein [Ceratobasidium sp. AG-Ba]